MRGSSLSLVEEVAKRFGPELRAKVAFLGGATIELLLTDPAVDEVRATKDVDVITAGRSRAAWFAPAVLFAVLLMGSETSCLSPRETWQARRRG
jgi:hypothetical protein